MSYQVLARKWRPKTFNEVVGQSHALNVLKNALTLGRMHHAYLFSGTRGVGKTSIARLLAKGLNCEKGMTAEPCGVCENCLDIEQGRFIDLIEVDAASRTKVEDTREILDNIQYLPTKGRFKVYLIDEVHMLSKSSFNALLKTLEEPPEYVKFLLATTDPQKLPVTILSRCLQLHLKAISVTDIQKQLDHILTLESISFEDNATELLAKSANGSMRDALSLTDQAIAIGNGKVESKSVIDMLGLLDNKMPLHIVQSLQMADGNELLSILNKVSEQGVDWDVLLSDTMTLLYQISLIQVIPNAVSQLSYDEYDVTRLAELMSPKDVQLIYQILLNGRKDLAFSPDKKLGVEMTFLRALAFMPTDISDNSDPIDTQITAKESALPKDNVIVKKKATDVLSNIKSELQIHSDQNQSLKSSSSASQTSLTQDNHVNDLPNQNSIKANLADDGISNITQSILKARENLIKQTAVKKKSLKSDLKITESVLERSQQSSSNLNERANMNEKYDESTNNEDDISNLDYQWQYRDPLKLEQINQSTISVGHVMQLDDSPELMAKLIKRVLEKDEWSREIEEMNIPSSLLKQVLLNSFVIKKENEYLLNLRSSESHLIKSKDHTKKLSELLSKLHSKEITVSIIENDDNSVLTPNELREKEYQLALQEAKESIKNDDKVKLICQFFNSAIDEESIRPV